MTQFNVVVHETRRQSIAFSFHSGLLGPALISYFVAFVLYTQKKPHLLEQQEAKRMHRRKKNVTETQSERMREKEKIDTKRKTTNYE